MAVENGILECNEQEKIAIFLIYEPSLRGDLLKKRRLILEEAIQINLGDEILVKNKGALELVIIQDGWRVEESIQIIGKIKYCEIEL